MPRKQKQLTVCADVAERGEDGLQSALAGAGGAHAQIEAAGADQLPADVVGVAVLPDQRRRGRVARADLQTVHTCVTGPNALQKQQAAYA